MKLFPTTKFCNKRFVEQSMFFSKDLLANTESKIGNNSLYFLGLRSFFREEKKKKKN